MNPLVLVTGSSGLIGSALCPALASHGIAVERLDLRATGTRFGDVRDPDGVRQVIQGCHGIIHLAAAAISRVVWAEQNPELCRSTNVGGLRNVLAAAAASESRPWIIFASSREVYGQPESLPATEDCPIRPMNVYGRSKVEGEQLITAARRDGLRACVIRLSNVYGSVADHDDRVVPAFARRAVAGLPLRIDGRDHTFDFTHIDDVARGIVSLAQSLLKGCPPPPPIHFVSGQPTTLEELARMAIRIAGTGARFHLAPPRTFDVSRFFGTVYRARMLLNWEPKISLTRGLTRLIEDFRAELATESKEAVPT